MGKQRKKPIGEVIKARRQKLKLKAEDVALKCNVSRSRVYQWERQSRVVEKNLKTLALALQMPLGRLKAANGQRETA